MATPYGLTPVGWLSKPLSQVDIEIDAGLQKILGKSAGTEPDGTIPVSGMAGQLKVLLDDGFGSMWDLLQALASALDPSQANDAAQDVVCSISGTIRNPAEFSTATIACTGVPNTPLSVGRVVTVETTAARFDSTIALNPADPNFPSSTILALGAWAVSTSYALNQRVTANGNAYQCTIPGESAGTGTGPAGTTPGAPIVDNAATWEYLGGGTGVVDVPFIAEVAGPVGALANTLIQIATPIDGWVGATNVNDAIVGALKESNSALRLRRDDEVASQGTTPIDAIRANILKVNQNSTDPNHQPPTSVKVLFNNSDAIDANGLPPHSIEVLVRGGTSADIAQAVWDSIAGGTNFYGNITSTITDEEGNPQTVRWSRPELIEIYVDMTVYYDPAKWPPSGAGPLVAAAAESALLTYGTGFITGQSVRSNPLSASVERGPSAVDVTGTVPIVPAPPGSSAIPGIVDVTPTNIGINPAPGSSAPVILGVRQLADFDSSRVTITTIAEVP